VVFRHEAADVFRARAIGSLEQLVVRIAHLEMTEPGGSGRAGDGHAISPVELAGDPRHVEPDEVQLIVGVVGQRALGKLELLVPADLGRNPDYGPDDSGQRPVLQLGHRLRVAELLPAEGQVQEQVADGEDAQSSEPLLIEGLDFGQLLHR